jgi:hypothetical protein
LTSFGDDRSFERDGGMDMKYECSKLKDPLDEYLRLEPLGATEEQIAVFHVVPLFTQGLSYIPPIDPEVGLTSRLLKKSSVRP